MNNDIISGKWTQLTGKAKETWGKLTNDDWNQLDGRREQLAGRLQERYGWTLDQANKEVDDFVTRSPEEYVERAIALSRQPDGLSALRGELRSRMERSTLVNGPLLALRIEKAYREMWHRAIEAE